MDVATAENPPSPPAKRRHPDVQKGKRGFVGYAVDWTAIREEYCRNALTVRQLAEKYQISTDAIYKRAERHKWPIPRKYSEIRVERMAKVAVKQHVRESLARIEPALEGAIREWQEETIGLAGKAKEQIREKLSVPLETEELKAVASTLDVVDRVGRRSLGLDKDATGGSGAGTILHMRLELLGLAGSPLPTGPTVEIQDLTEPAQEGAEGPASPV